MTDPRLSIITCCKGRLEYLKRSLPTFAAQSESEVVVVDYDCPEGTGQWVAAHYPRARLVAVADAPRFNVSHARNLGAQQARAPWLVFCDADDVLSPSFATDLLRKAKPGTYQRTLRGSRPEAIPLACEAATFKAVGGYDDALQGWGLEDFEIISRLRQSGAREVRSVAVGQNLQHSKAECDRYYEHVVETSVVINYYYCYIKRRYFETAGRWFTDQQRYSTYRSVAKAVLASLADVEGDATFDIPIVASEPPWAARLAASDVRRMSKIHTHKINKKGVLQI
jgi:glycosyltransferase involved in cell wall biosynthesis